MIIDFDQISAKSIKNSSLGNVYREFFLHAILKIHVIVGVFF